MKKVILFYFAFITAGYAQNALDKGFQNPPIDARPKALWDWVNGNYNYPQLKSELESAKAAGMGGFDIWDVGTISSQKNKANVGPKFLSESSADAIAYAVQEAKNCGLEIGLISSSSWNAGGDWITTKESCKGIFKSDTTILGGSNVVLQLPLPKLDKNGGAMSSEPINFVHMPLVSNILVQAVETTTKRKIDLTAMVDNSGRLLWKVPTGKWTISRYVSATTGELLKVPSVNSVALMLDHFSAEAQEKNMNYILEKLSSRLGQNLGKTALKYIYVDSYEVSGSLWSPAFPAEFKARRGYDALHLLPALFDSTYLPADSLQRFRYDVARTFSDMIIENHYLKGQKMCEPYGIGYAAEAAGPGAPVHNCPFESIRSAGVVGNTRGEFWLNRNYDTLKTGDYTLDMIKGVASAAHVYGKKYVEAESFTTAAMYDENFNEMKRALDNAFTWGLNRVVFHTFQHNPAEAGSPGYNYPFGVVFGTFQPWWKMVKGFNDYIARCSYMLQQGTFVADVLYYYGDKAPNFVKETTLARMVGKGYDYDVANTEILLKKLQVKNGLLTLPEGQTYKILVMPNSEAMPLEVLRKVAELIKNGATVLCPKPTKVHTLHQFHAQEKELTLLASTIWRNIDGKTVKQLNYGLGKIVHGKKASEVLAEMKVGQDFSAISASDTSRIQYIHRHSATGDDIYFISNQRFGIDRFDATFRATGKTAELWNTKTGEITKLPYGFSNGHSTTIPLELAAYESVFVIFKNAKPTTFTIASMRRDGKTIFPLDKSNAMPLFAAGNVETTASKTQNYIVREKDIAIKGAWQIRFPRISGAPPYNTFDSLVSWTTSPEVGIKYFSGEATYYKTFTLTAADLQAKTSALLQLDTLQNMGEIWLNGKPLGYVWSVPYQIEVGNALREGENNLVIAVTNGFNNRQVGDGIENRDRPYTYSNIEKGGCAWCKPWKDVPLIKAGLIGRVNLKIWYKQ